MRAVALITLLALLSVPIPASEYLLTEHWIGLDASPTANESLSREQAVERLLNEARYVISGMIYGFTFEYRPSDATRGIQEQFELEPVFQIPQADPAVTVLQSWVDGSRLYVRIGYELHPEQEAWFASWQSSAIPVVTGSGAASWFGGFAQRFAAIEDAVRAGCREYLRARTFARPASASGSIVLREYPRMAVRAGSYTATARFSLRIEKLRAYETF